MKESSTWVSEKEASQVLRVNQKILEICREEGFLKPGIHWKSSPDADHLPWKPKASYCIRLCKAAIEKRKNDNHYLYQF